LCIENWVNQTEIKIEAARQDIPLRETFAVDASLYDSSMLVFVDEAGTDTGDTAV